MMTREDLESYLIRMELDYQEIADGLWLIKSGDNTAPIVVNYSPAAAESARFARHERRHAARAALPSSAGAERHGHPARQLRHRGAGGRAVGCAPAGNPRFC